MTDIPEASGFALALETYLNRGGGRTIGGRTKSAMRGKTFTSGPMKGKTLGEATNEARRLWANAPPALKEKYARQAREGMLAPSEQARYAGPGATNNAPRFPAPGDRDGNGIPDAMELGGFAPNLMDPDQPRTIPLKSPTPFAEETRRAQEGLREVLDGGGEFGPTSWASPGNGYYGKNFAGDTRSTDRAPNPGLVPNPNNANAPTPSPQHQAAPVSSGNDMQRSREVAEAGTRDKRQTGSYVGFPSQAPAASPPIEPERDTTPTPKGQVLVGMKSGRKIFAPGDPSKMGAAAPADYDPTRSSAYAGPRITTPSKAETPGYAGPALSFDPSLGYVPKAQPVPEELSYQQYDSARTAWKGNPTGKTDPNLATMRAFRMQEEARKRRN